MTHKTTGPTRKANLLGRLDSVLERLAPYNRAIPKLWAHTPKVIRPFVWQRPDLYMPDMLAFETQVAGEALRKLRRRAIIGR